MALHQEVTQITLHEETIQITLHEEAIQITLHEEATQIIEIEIVIITEEAHQEVVLHDGTTETTILVGIKTIIVQDIQIRMDLGDAHLHEVMDPHGIMVLHEVMDPHGAMLLHEAMDPHVLMILHVTMDLHVLMILRVTMDPHVDLHATMDPHVDLRATMDPHVDLRVIMDLLDMTMDLDMTIDTNWGPGQQGARCDSMFEQESTGAELDPAFEKKFSEALEQRKKEKAKTAPAKKGTKV